MASSILHQGASVMCNHAGTATPSSCSTRVSVSGQAVVTLSSPYSISGCSLSYTATSTFCINGQWIAGAQRVLVEGSPVVTSTGQAVCTETGGGLSPVQYQSRVSAT